MQNKLLKITQIGFALVILAFAGVLPANAKQIPSSSFPAIMLMIQAAGYRCDKVDSAISWNFSRGITAFCNGLRYHYEIEDKGGNIVVTVQ